MTIISRNIRRDTKPSKANSGGNGNTSDELIKVSDKDTESGYLADKLVSERTFPTVSITPVLFLTGNQQLYLSSESYFSNTIFVDAIYGQDRSGEREKVNRKFATLQQAVSSAKSGDRIIVSGNLTAPVNIVIDKDLNIQLLGNFTSQDASTAFTINNASVKFSGTGNLASAGQLFRCNNGNVEIEGFNNITNRYGLFYISRGTFKASHINKISMLDGSPTRPGFLPRFAFVLAGRGNAVFENIGQIIIDSPYEAIHFFGKFSFTNISLIDIKRGALCFGPNVNDKICLYNVKRIIGGDVDIQGFVEAYDCNITATGSIISTNNTQCTIKMQRCNLESSTAIPVQSDRSGGFKLEFRDCTIVAPEDYEAIDWQGELNVYNSDIYGGGANTPTIRYAQDSVNKNEIAYSKVVNLAKGNCMEFTPQSGMPQLLVSYIRSTSSIRGTGISSSFNKVDVNLR